MESWSMETVNPSLECGHAQPYPAREERVSPQVAMQRPIPQPFSGAHQTWSGHGPGPHKTPAGRPATPAWPAPPWSVGCVSQGQRYGQTSLDIRKRPPGAGWLRTVCVKDRWEAGKVPSPRFWAAALQFHGIQAQQRAGPSAHACRHGDKLVPHQPGFGPAACQEELSNGRPGDTGKGDLDTAVEVPGTQQWWGWDPGDGAWSRTPTSWARR